MATHEELDIIQEKSIAFRKSLGIKEKPLEVKDEPLEPISDLMDTKSYDVDLIPPELRTKDDWAEIIPTGIKSKVHFTVSIATPTNDKFNDIMMYYQTKMGPIAKVYKHLVLQLIINEAWERLRRSGQI